MDAFTMKADVGEDVLGECGGTKMVRLRHFSYLLLCIMHIGIEDAKMEGMVGSSQGGPSPHSMALVVTFVPGTPAGDCIIGI